MEHGVVAMVGSGKQGKSASLHSLLAHCQPDRPVCMLDPMDIPIEIYPENYTHVRKSSEVPVGSIVVIEDVNRAFSSRGSSRDSTLQSWLGIISHRSNLVCFTSQNLASTDLEFARSQDYLILSKRMCGEDIRYERDGNRSAQAVANYWISEAEKIPDCHPKSWVYFQRFNECVSIELVPWWTEEHSKMFRDVRL